MKKITLGILGGGQLGRMSADAAKALDIQTVIYCPKTNSPAAQIADSAVTGAYDNEETLEDFAARCDFITYEFENIPLKTVRFLKKFTPVYPGENLLEIAQDRLKEKDFLNRADIKTAKWAPARSPQEIKNILKSWKQETAIIKTIRFGYDGKGQALVKNSKEEHIQNSWNQLKADIVIVEEVIDFKCEISVIIARDSEGNTATYGPQLNEHKNHILHTTRFPAPLSSVLAKNAATISQNLAEALDLRGMFGLEMFVTKDGRLLANEIAPRPHNSGHWTIEGCAVSQFENHVRAVCGLPVADPSPCRPATMINLIGADVENITPYEENPQAHIHLYGKDAIRPGRKMGHVTILEKDNEQTSKE